MAELEIIEPDQKLGKAETFIKGLNQLKSTHNRLIMWNFRAKWPELLAVYDKTVEVQKALFVELKTNKYMHRLFAMTLSVGNVLNGGSDKG